MLMAYEVTRDMPMQDIEIETPLETMNAKVIDGKKVVLVSILRAGTGILDGMLSVVPGARVGHIGLYLPSRQVSRQTNLIDFGFSSLSRSTAATAELPVASIGSTTIASRSSMPPGILK
jgi:uracil phosphoribosyltransferase